MSVRRRAIRERVAREKQFAAQFAAQTAALEQLRRDLPAIVLEHKLRAHERLRGRDGQ